MMKSLAQTGNGWMTFKDAANTKCNQTGTPGKTVHLSNLCTEIIEVTNKAETAVCNLGSINLAPGSFDARRELAIDVDGHHVVDRLNKVAAHDWEHSHPIDLSDEGLKADLEKRDGAGADKLVLEPGHEKKHKHKNDD